MFVFWFALRIIANIYVCSFELSQNNFFSVIRTKLNNLRDREPRENFAIHMQCFPLAWENPIQIQNMSERTEVKLNFCSVFFHSLFTRAHSLSHFMCLCLFYNFVQNITFLLFCLSKSDHSRSNLNTTE